MHPPDDRALHEMNPTGRFTDRAEDYARYRPTYPAAAIDCVLRGLGDPTGIVAADVGAGTGISARLLADRGIRVFAVEPNAAMREAAVPHERVTWREGAAESTGLAPASVDLVLCAQAFHWFRQGESVAEFHRILRPGGRLVVMWNSRDRGDPFTLGYIEAIRAVNGEHPAETREYDRGVVHRDGLFTELSFETFQHSQELDRAGLIGRAASASYVPKEGEGFARLTELLESLFERYHDARGLVTLRYNTDVYRSERR
jgi:SAM-dependent methyltransferase